MMLKSALSVLRTQKDVARSVGLLPAYREGVAAWKSYYVGLWLGAVAPAARSRKFDSVLARQGMSLISMAPITVIRLAFDRLAGRFTARIKLRIP